MSKRLLTICNLTGYLFFVAVWIIAYLFYKEYVLIVLLVFAVLLCPVSVVTTYYLRKRIEVGCEFDRKQCQKEDGICVRFSVSNPCMLSSRNITLKVKMWNTYIGDKEYYYVNMPIKMKGKRQAELNIRSIHLGMLNCEIEEYIISDWLGFANLVKTSNALCQTYVMPEAVDIKINYEYAGSNSGTKDTLVMAKKGDDVSEVNEIREYIAGDRIQNIHWKLSAKSDDFMVKDYSRPVNNEICILFDLRKDAPDDIVELGIAIIQYLCEKRQSMYVSWYANTGLEEEYLTSAEEIQRIIHNMYEVIPDNNGIRSSDYYINMNPGVYGKCLYICDKNDIPPTENQKPEAEYKEAVAVWL